MSVQLIKTIRDFELTGKRVFMRLDFNVPLSEPDASGHRAVEEDQRIREALPTIQYAIEKGAKIVIASHLGRPDGKENPAFSLEPVGLRKLVRDLDRTFKAMGDGKKKVYESERAPIIKMGKSLVVARNLPSGHVIGPKDVVMKSPGGGIPPYDLDKVIGRVTLKPLHEDDFLSFDVLSKADAELARS